MYPNYDMHHGLVYGCDRKGGGVGIQAQAINVKKKKKKSFLRHEDLEKTKIDKQNKSSAVEVPGMIIRQAVIGRKTTIFQVWRVFILA